MGLWSRGGADTETIAAVAAAAERECLIDAASSVDGTVEVGHDLRVEGRVTGQVRCGGTLTVAEGATVDATVSAGTVIVAGTLGGGVTCQTRLVVLPSGRVGGVVTTPALTVQEGAVFECELRMRQAVEAAEAAPRPTGPQRNRPRPAAAGD